MNSWWENWWETRKCWPETGPVMLMLCNNSSNSCLMCRVDLCSCRFWSRQRRRSQTPVVRWLLPGTWPPNRPRNEARVSRPDLYHTLGSGAVHCVFISLLYLVFLVYRPEQIRGEPFNFTNGFLFPLQDHVSVWHEQRNTGGTPRLDF